jgi:hypothetical protein
MSFVLSQNGGGMRLPKSIQINGRPWRVIRNKRIYGGACHTHPGTIEIGNVANNDQEFEVLIHEILEGILLSGGRRYENNADEQMFCFDHHEFIAITKELSAAIRPLFRMN